MLHVLRQPVSERPILSNWQALLDYLQADIGGHRVEQFRVLHLNTRNVLIRDDLMARGTVDEAPVYVREVLHRAMDLGSTALILIHNHPSGDPTPSGSDVALTKKIMAAAAPLGITVHDHLVIASGGHVSLRARGLL